MNVYQIFQDFATNLIVANEESIESRFATITRRLNLDFHNINSNSENGIYVGSYGRNTAINGVSDLDLLFILPDSHYSKYNNREGNKQSQLLQDVKNSISKTYSQSEVRGDGQVVVIKFNNDFIEVCPVFKENDGSFTYPDSNSGGSWKKTNPSPESQEIFNFNIECNGNLVILCKIVRAWKNKSGAKIGGLLIDTLVYNFFKENPDYKKYTFENYDLLIRDFFDYLKELNDDRVYWYAPGSKQHVYKKNSNFKIKAKKAFATITEAIEKNDNNGVYEVWRRVFGRTFPYPKAIKESSYNYNDAEEYIEDRYPLNIKYKLRIDCEITQDGYRTGLLRTMKYLSKHKKLLFFIDKIDVPLPYEVLWKIKNEGEIAHNKNCLRGQIINSNYSSNKRKESSDFEGAHYAECYIIKDEFCVARDRIDVPISNR